MLALAQANESPLSRSAALALGTTVLLVSAIRGQHPTYSPKIAEASPDAQRAIAGFKTPTDLRTELIAAEPILANPVAFTFDDVGRILVCETYRLHAGVTDNRRHTYWVDDDLAANTVADRIAFYQKHLGEKFASYGKEHERLRLLIDDDGDGKPDRSTVFADGFKEPADGIAAGVLARGGNVWYTCIPKLWQLRDDDGDGQADTRKVLHDGFGVHVALLGHDMHGLTFGPDGKLYFSIGDRGFHVVADDEVLAYPHEGAVLRCEPDGSELEVFATGLRNPQELAFDAFGNLFTGDNNSDGGDKARWVHVVEGGDCGWRMAFQYLRDRGPWNREKLWHPRFPGQAAWVRSPIANVTDGPSGLAYYPGTGLPARYDDTFFLCDFRGGAARSGVWAFRNAPKGAGFELVQTDKIIWNVLPTDIEFGPQAGLYVLDWIHGWDAPGKGRIYRVFAESEELDAQAAAVAAILRDGMNTRGPRQLLGWLDHRDQRVRQRAQFELASRGMAHLDDLLALAADTTRVRLARVHALWAAGRIVHRHHAFGDRAKTIAELFRDPDGELRAQAARVVGWNATAAAKLEPANDPASKRKRNRSTSLVGGLVSLLGDRSSRVRYFAAMTLGKIGNPAAREPLFAMLRHNNDRDETLRHAGVFALASLGEPEALMRHANGATPAERLAIVLTLRRLRREELAEFVTPKVIRDEPQLAIEAARAIHDLPVRAAFGSLAATLDQHGEHLQSRALVHRALNAAFHLGGELQARRIAAAAAALDLRSDMRIEALRMLRSWSTPSGRDAVLGLWRPIAKRAARPAAVALADSIDGLLTGTPIEIRKAALDAAKRLRLPGAASAAFALATNRKADPSLRADALRLLVAVDDSRLPSATQVAVASNHAELRSAAYTALSKLDPASATTVIESVLGSTADSAAEQRGQRAALHTLAKIKSTAAAELLGTQLGRLESGSLPAGLELDVLDACEANGDPSLTKRLHALTAKTVNATKDDPLAPYRACLEGGDKQRGRRVFTDHLAAQCMRCHRIDPKGKGGEAGPPLAGIGKRRDREFLLRSLIEPSKDIAPGYGTIVVMTKAGDAVAGVLKRETRTALEVLGPEGKTTEVAKSDIASRTQPTSAMPPMGLLMSKRELRDLVEFLATRK